MKRRTLIVFILIVLAAFGLYTSSLAQDETMAR